MPDQTEQTNNNLALVTTSDQTDLARPFDYPMINNPAAIYLGRLRAGNGQRAMLHHLNTVAGLLSAGRFDASNFNWPALRYNHTSQIERLLTENAAKENRVLKPATINQALCAVRGVLTECWKLELIDSESYYRARAVKSVKADSLPAGRGLLRGELAALIETCINDESPAGFRDAAMIATLYGAGLRRSELVKLQLSDYDEQTSQLTVKSGKGNKDRLVYPLSGAEPLKDWLSIRGNQPGPLFLAINKSGKIDYSRQLTDQTVLHMLAKRAEQAKVKHFSPHDLRRSYISDLLQAGADIATVQKLAGHATVITTARYDRRGEQAKKDASTLLSLPYQRRQAVKS